MGGRGQEVAREQEERLGHRAVKAGSSAHPSSAREGGRHSSAHREHQGEVGARAAACKQLGQRSGRGARNCRGGTRGAAEGWRLWQGCHAHWGGVVRDLFGEFTSWIRRNDGADQDTETIRMLF